MIGRSGTADQNACDIVNDRRHFFLSIVIPAYNESRRLPQTLDRILDYLSASPSSATPMKTTEIVIVDDGSSDETASIALSYQHRYPYVTVLSYQPNRGKGYAVKTGIMKASGEFILFSDADLSTPIQELEKALPYVQEHGYDIAIASRGLPQSQLLIRQPFYREWMGRVFNLAVQVLALPGIWDSQCGFKLFRCSVAHRIFPLVRLKGFAFDVEVLFIARRLGFKIKEVPVVWRNDPETKVRTFQDGMRMVVDLLRIRLYHLCGFYKEKDSGKT
ncbi:MAG: glycosyltransferase family 2 protein [Armatimonadetes bacterium]|nr:glycosyltransferase family 2 protein [Armatimonadota bacterium]MDW8122835.1 glycosyltransferase family 2 protein [Armatimonadota bacterium]